MEITEIGIRVENNPLEIVNFLRNLGLPTSGMRGNAENNSCYYYIKDEFSIKLDCSMEVPLNIKIMNLEQFKNIVFNYSFCFINTDTKFINLKDINNRFRFDSTHETYYELNNNIDMGENPNINYILLPKEIFAKLNFKFLGNFRIEYKENNLEKKLDDIIGNVNGFKIQGEELHGNWYVGNMPVYDIAENHIRKINKEEHQKVEKCTSDENFIYFEVEGKKIKITKQQFADIVDELEEN